MDQPGLQRRQPPAAAQGEQAEPHPQRQHRVGPGALCGQVVHLVEGAAIGVVAGGDQAVAGEVREHRDAGRLHEPQELVGDPCLEGPDAGHDHRPLGLGQDIQRRRQSRRRGRGAGVQDDGVGDPDAVLVHLGAQHVGGQVQEHRTGGTRGRQPDGVGHQPWQVGDVRHPVRPLGDRGDHGDLVDAGLQGVGLGVSRAGRAGEVEHRRPVQIGIGDGRDDVGEPRPGGGHGHAQRPPRPRIALGCVAGGHLVAHVGDRQAMVQAGLEDGLKVRPVQAEDVLHPRLHQRPHHQLPARHHGHFHCSSFVLNSLSNHTPRPTQWGEGGARCKATGG